MVQWPLPLITLAFTFWIDCSEKTPFNVCFSKGSPYKYTYANVNGKDGAQLYREESLGKLAKVAVEKFTFSKCW